MGESKKPTGRYRLSSYQLSDHYRYLPTRKPCDINPPCSDVTY